MQSKKIANLFLLLVSSLSPLSFVYSCSTVKSELEKGEQTTVKSGLTVAQIEGLSQNLNDAYNQIDPLWVFNNFAQLFDGGHTQNGWTETKIKSVTNNKNEQTKTLIVNVVFEPNTIFGEDRNLITTEKTLVVEISGFNNPNNPIVKQQNQHSLSLNFMLNASSPLEIIKNSPLYKESLNNLMINLKGGPNSIDLNGGEMDFTYNPKPEEIVKFFEQLQNIGHYGDFGSTIDKKMMYTPADEYPGLFMKQLYLPNFDENLDTIDALKMSTNIDNIIQQNQFGFLPSNLSQFFYYLELKDITNIFGLTNEVKTIKMNFDDNLGKADILIICKNNKKYLYNYLSSDMQTTQSLKKDKDFRQYIYDRSFKIVVPQQLKFTKYVNPFNAKVTFKLDKKSTTGTGWILDRVRNSKLGPNQYEFLVGTNMHVLDFSHGYNKDRNLSTNLNNFSQKWEVIGSSKTSTIYNEKWDGGLFYKGGVNQVNADKIATILDPTTKIEYQKIEQRHLDISNPIKISKPTELDVDNVKDKETISFSSSNTQYDQTNIIDAIWYTPELTTSGIWSNKNILWPIFDVDTNNVKNDDLRTAYVDWNGKYAGKTTSGGADFAISKIVLNKSDIQTLFPSLYKVIDTADEHNWYMGIGRNNKEVEISANSSLFSGGYPSGVYSDRKWNSGRILEQTRYFSNEPTATTATKYWTRYDDLKNEKFNTYRGLSNWYKNTTITPSSLTPEQNAKFFPRGMEIQKLIQLPLFNASYNGSTDFKDVMEGGVSGSMVINSRFELVGSLFSYILWDGIDSQRANNIFQVFKHYTEENKTFSIINQIKEKLISENLKTFKINF